MRLGVGRDADVLVPEVGVVLDEALHEGDAAGVVEDAEVDAFGAEPVFAALEGSVLADDDARDSVEDGGAGAHGAGAEGGGEGEGVPIAAAAGVSDAGGLGVGGGVSGLDAEVVASGDDGAVGGEEGGADGDATLGEGLVGLFEGGVEGEAVEVGHGGLLGARRAW